MNRQEFFDDLIECLNKEYDSKDYMSDIISLNRVEEDRNRCINYVANFLNNISDISEKELILVMYSNFFIKYGMAGRFQIENRYAEYDGLEKIFENSVEEKEHLKKVYLTAKYQNDAAWKEILEYNPNSIIAKLYIFVKLCCKYSYNVSKKIDSEIIDVDKYKEMWELFEKIPDDWKKYVLGDYDDINETEHKNYAVCNKLLPFVRFISTKEILMEYIPAYYSNILKKLNVPLDTKPGDAYSEIYKALGIDSLRLSCPEDFIQNIDLKLQPASSDGYIKVPVSTMVSLVKKNAYTLNFLLQLEKVANEQDPDLVFLAEKIHILAQNEMGQLDWLESKYFFEEYDWSTLTRRNLYIHTPTNVDIKRSLFESHFEVYLKNRYLQKNAEQKKDMMDYYAHSWKHISYPQIVKEVAEELGKTNRVIANRLMKAYNSERTLQRGIQLLQYISADDEKKVSIEFKKGIAKSGSDSDKYHNLFQVICDSLDIVIFKILMVESDDSTTIKRCRDKWNSIKSLDNLREEYTNMFLEKNNDTINIFDWANTNLINLELNVSDEWNDVRFKEDSFAINQFKEILVEIFTNIFLHGESYAKLNFFATEKEMVIVETNKCCDNIPGSQSGISTMKKVLDYLNIETNIESLHHEIDEDYSLQIKLNKKLLIRRGR